MNPSRPGLHEFGVMAADGLAAMAASLQEVGDGAVEAMLKVRAEGPSKSGYRNPPKHRGNRWKRRNRKKLSHLRGRW